MKRVLQKHRPNQTFRLARGAVGAPSLGLIEAQSPL